MFCNDWLKNGGRNERTNGCAPNASCVQMVLLLNRDGRPCVEIDCRHDVSRMSIIVVDNSQNFFWKFEIVRIFFQMIFASKYCFTWQNVYLFLQWIWWVENKRLEGLFSSQFVHAFNCCISWEIKFNSLQALVTKIGSQ